MLLRTGPCGFSPLQIKSPVYHNVISKLAFVLFFISLSHTCIWILRAFFIDLIFHLAIKMVTFQRASDLFLQPYLLPWLKKTQYISLYELKAQSYTGTSLCVIVLYGYQCVRLMILCEKSLYITIDFVRHIMYCNKKHHMGPLCMTAVGNWLCRYLLSVNSLLPQKIALSRFPDFLARLSLKLKP